MAAPLVTDALRNLGFTTSVRLNQQGERYATDQGNLIIDCSGLIFEDPAEIAARINSIVGVVEHGLFLKMANLALIAGATEVIERSY